MKKAFIFSILILSMIGLVMAQEVAPRDGTGPYHEEILATGGQNGTSETMLLGMQGENSEFKNEFGETVRVQGSSKQIRLQVGNTSANCSCNLFQEKVQNQTRIYANLSNGKKAEIKVMPNVASTKALERLKLKNCNGNCSIELKEVGEGNQTRMAYEVKTTKQAKFLGIFKTEMKVEAQVDAENGEVLKAKKPWWAFMSSIEE